MKKILKIIGIVLGSLVIVVLIAAAIINFTDTQTFEVMAPDVTVKMDSISIAEGKRTAQMVCMQCHLNNGTLEGKMLEEEGSPFGTIWASNITQHKDHGIGKYTDGELIYLLRTGIARDGKYFPPWMPKFPNMADEDMNNIIAWLRSDMPEVQASDNIVPKSEYSFLTKALMRIAFKPLPYDAKPISVPAKTDKVAYGKYLSTAKLDCFGCHSLDFKTQNLMEPEKTPGYFGGGNPFEKEGYETIYSSNLTPDLETGIGNWTEEQFIKVLKTGIKADGTSMRPPMIPYPLLSDEEISAIWAYLQSIPAINNDINGLD